MVDLEEFKMIELPADALPAIDELTGDLRLVALVVGVENALKLGQMFKGVPIRLWNTEKFIRRYRDNCIRRDSETMSGRELALKYTLTERQVWNILGTTDRGDERQMSLF